MTVVEYDYDLFMSHASEDKAGFVRELVDRLRDHGLRVWFDEAELQVGDVLTERIDAGLARSRFGVVVLSPAFLSKPWPRAELDALASIEMLRDEVVVLPIWLNVGSDDVRRYSPLLARKLALISGDGLEMVAAQVVRRVRGGAALPPTATTPSSAVLQPEILRGRLLPSIYAPVVRGDERALVSRVALAATASSPEPKPKLRTAEQDLFVHALNHSSLDVWLHGLSSPLPYRASGIFWQLDEPIRSWMITAIRLPQKMTVDGWSVEGRATITLKPAPSVGPAGWLILNLDVVIRPASNEPRSPETKEWTPLSLDDLVGLLYIPLSSLLDDVAPALLPTIGEVQPLAVGCLLLPNGDEFNRYVNLDGYASGRVGTTGPYAIDWQPSDLDELMNPETRFVAVRDQIEGLFGDGGYRGYERSLELVKPPRLER